MPEDKMEEQEVNLRDLISIVLKRKKLIIIVTLVSMLVAGVFSYFILPPVYEAKVVFLVANPNIKTSENITPFEQVISPASFLANPSISTYINIISSEPFLSEAISSSDYSGELTFQKLLSGVKAENPKDSNLIIVRINFSDPELAHRIAEKIAKIFPSFVQELNKVDFSSSETFIESQIGVSEKNLEAKEKPYTEEASYFVSKLLTVSKENLQQKESSYISLASTIAVDELGVALANLTKATSDYQAFLSSESNIDVLTKQLDLALGKIPTYEDSLERLAIDIAANKAQLQAYTEELFKEAQFITLKQSVADSPFLTQLINSSDNPNFRELVNLQVESTQLNPVYEKISSNIAELQAYVNKILQEQSITQKMSEQNLSTVYSLQKSLADRKVILEKLQKNLDLATSDYVDAYSHYNDFGTMLSINAGGLIAKDPKFRGLQQQLIALKRDYDKAYADYTTIFSIYKDISTLANIDIGGILSTYPMLREEQLKFLSLRRELSLARDRYELLKKSYSEVKILGAMNIANVKLVLEPAIPQNPVGPKKLFIIAVAGVVALFFSILLAFFLEYLYGDKRKEVK